MTLGQVQQGWLTPLCHALCRHGLGFIHSGGLCLFPQEIAAQGGVRWFPARPRAPLERTPRESSESPAPRSCAWRRSLAASQAGGGSDLQRPAGQARSTTPSDARAPLPEGERRASPQPHGGEDPEPRAAGPARPRHAARTPVLRAVAPPPGRWAEEARGGGPAQAWREPGPSCPPLVLRRAHLGAVHASQSPTEAPPAA